MDSKTQSKTLHRLHRDRIRAQQNIRFDKVTEGIPMNYQDRTTKIGEGISENPLARLSQEHRMQRRYGHHYDHAY